MKKAILNYSIGSDIEFFLRKKGTEEIVSAEGIIKGSKHDPHYFDPNNPFFATSLDNVMAEGNIPPAKTPFEFYQHVQTLINYIQKTVGNDLEVLSIPSARLDEKYLQSEVSRMFGCDPSWNCWTEDVVHPQPSGDNIRCTGFHVHVGYDNPSEDANYALAKAMDLYLGVPAVLMEPKNERKAVGYGTAGNFRHQRHGMEYRSLSGFFSSSKALIEWAFSNAVKAVDFVNEGKLAQILGMGDVIQNTVNTEDKKTAEKLCKDFGINLI